MRRLAISLPVLPADADELVLELATNDPAVVAAVLDQHLYVHVLALEGVDREQLRERVRAHLTGGDAPPVRR